MLTNVVGMNEGTGNGKDGGWLGEVAAEDMRGGENEGGGWFGGGGGSGRLLSRRKHFARFGRGGGFREGLLETGPKADI